LHIGAMLFSRFVYNWDDMALKINPKFFLFFTIADLRADVHCHIIKLLGSRIIVY